MTQTPPRGPEPKDLFSRARELARELQRLTTDIQTHVQNPAASSLPQLSQLIFQREERLAELTQMGLQQLPEAEQAVLLEILQECQGVDSSNEQHLTQYRDNLAAQIRNLKGGQTLLSKYKINNPKEASTHSQEA